MAAHTNFVPDVTQPWLSDGDHAKARSPSLSAVATWLPLAMRDSPGGSSHPGEGTRCFLNLGHILTPYKVGTPLASLLPGEGN